MQGPWQSGVWAVALAAFCAVPGFAQSQQQTGSPAKPAQQSQAAPPDAPQATTTPNSADDNAFPEAKSEAAQKKAQDDADKQTNNAFPQAQSKAAEKAAGNGDNAAAPPSSGEPYSSSATRTKGLDLLGDKDSRVSDGAGHFVNNPTLAKEDIRVGRFYLAQQNYAGAYMRLKEATEVAPGNVEAVYLLAEASRKTSHLDEAESNFRLYLNVEPKGKYAKDARKALAELSGK